MKRGRTGRPLNLKEKFRCRFAADAAASIADATFVATVAREGRAKSGVETLSRRVGFRVYLLPVKIACKDCPHF